MFENKRNHLYETSVNNIKTASGIKKELKDMNILERYAYEQGHATESGNGAYKLSTTGNIFLDDFGSIGRYKENRKPSEIFETVDAEWAVDPEKTLRMALYIRAISRNTKYGSEMTKVVGQGLRHEYFFRLLRIASKDLRNFEENFPVLIAAGSEKDLFDLWRIQLEYGEKVIPESVFLRIITVFLGRDIVGAVGPDNLMLKYLPTIRTKKGQKTFRFEANSYIGRKISDYLWPDLPVDSRRKAYRQLKSSGSAHEWQQKISRGKFTDIDWNKVSGKALTILSRSKFLVNHGLNESFQTWVSKQETIKTTSYPHDLICPKLDKLQQEVANKQFEELIKKSRECRSSMLTAIDVSGSMGSCALGTKYKSIQVAYAMAAFFAKTLKGEFANAYVTFSDCPTLRFFEPNETPYDCVHNHDTEYDFGSTDFQGVIRLLCNMKKQNPSVPEYEFPTGILCISDGEFNWSGNHISNFHEARIRLRKAGFSEDFVQNFSIVLWDIPNSFYGRTKQCFETLGDEEGFYYMSGFDASGISFLTSGIKPKTGEELMEKALSQDLLTELKVFKG